ncbi:MAG: tetratricopeptide repeat protein, partial [Isosphaeraceae bacterium]
MGQAFWNVPHPRNPSFSGREAEIAGLRERLARKRKTALAQAISGLGGIGKTQTAVEYAYRYRDEYKAVLWLNAESSLSLKTGCGDIARQMPLPHDEKDLDQAAAAVKYWLGTHPDWLLILDNADDPAVLEPFLPTDHAGHILITS